MEVIILNGLIASGKTTLGKLLTHYLNTHGSKSTFYDLDDLVEKRNPQFNWESKDAQIKDWLDSRKELADLTNEGLKQGNIVVVVGPFFQKDEITGFTKYLISNTDVYLYTLTIPLTERLKRNQQRELPNSIEDLESQQRKFESLSEHFGYNIENNGSESESLDMLVNAMNKDLGKISL